MTIQDYRRVLRERWIIIVSAALVAMIGAGAAWSLRPPEYTAKLTMYVSAQAADTANAAYQGSLLSEQRVSSYVKLVGSTRVSRAVIRDLGLIGTPEAVAGQVFASSTPESVLIEVAVVGGSPEEAAAVANSVGRVFIELVAELERPSAPGDVTPVAVRVVEPATVPTRPSSTGLPVTLVLGLLGGAAVGLGLALARNAMDTSIKSVEQLRDAAGAPNLGTIAYDGKIPKQPLTVHEDPQSPRAEAFRQLRTNLQYVDVDNPRKVIVVTSALPGEGKTTSVCNLAIAMAAAGTRVLVVEADLRRPEMADLLGLDGSAGLTDILAGRLRSQQVIQPWAGGSFDVLASGPLPPNPSELLASRQMGDAAGRAPGSLRRGSGRLAAPDPGHRRGGDGTRHRRGDPGLPVQEDDAGTGGPGGGRAGRCLGATAGDRLDDGPQVQLTSVCALQRLLPRRAASHRRD